MLRWRRNGIAGQLESTDGRFWLVNQSHYMGRATPWWNVMVSAGDGRWTCDDSACGLMAAKLAAEELADRRR